MTPGWIACVSDSNSTKPYISVLCCKTDSPLQYYKESVPGLGVVIIRCLAFVSHVDLGYRLLIDSMKQYDPYPNAIPDHGFLHVPNQRVLTSGFSKVINRMNEMGETDGSVCAILCKPHKIKVIGNRVTV